MFLNFRKLYIFWFIFQVNFPIKTSALISLFLLIHWNLQCINRNWFGDLLKDKFLNHLIFIKRGLQPWMFMFSLLKKRNKSTVESLLYIHSSFAYITHSFQAVDAPPGVLDVHILLALFREITTSYARSNGQDEISSIVCLLYYRIVLSSVNWGL